MSERLPELNWLIAFKLKSCAAWRYYVEQYRRCGDLMAPEPQRAILGMSFLNAFGYGNVKVNRNGFTSEVLTIKKARYTDRAVFKHCKFTRIQSNPR